MPTKKEKKAPRRTPELDLEKHELLQAERKAAAARNLQLKRSLAIEAKSTKINRPRIVRQFRRILRAAKTAELRREVGILSEDHERNVARRDAILRILGRDLEDVEDQFLVALRAHLTNVDGLVELHGERLLALEQDFRRELSAAEEEQGAQQNDIERAHARDVQELEDVADAIYREESRLAGEAKHEHEATREEIRTRNSDAIQLLRITLDQRIEELERGFEAARFTYLEETDTRTTVFRQLTRRDKELSREIEARTRRLDRLKSDVRRWQAKIRESVRESAERNSMLMKERSAIQQHFLRLKGRMSRFRDSQALRTSDLARNANDALGSLKEQKDLAQRILKLGEISRRLETEQEAVAPFRAAEHSDALDNKKDALLGGAGARQKAATPSPYQTSATDRTGAAVSALSYLERFNRKFNKVALDTLAIQSTRDRREEERSELQRILKQCLDGISVNENFAATPNPLLIINGRASLNRPLPVRRNHRPTVIDASTIMASARASHRRP